MEKLAIRFFGKKSSKGNDMQLLQSDGQATCYARVDSSEKSDFTAHVARPESETAATQYASDRRRARLSLRSERSGRAAAAAKPVMKSDAETDAVVQHKKSAYVPTHAGSDFGNMPLPTTFRNSQVYERRHGNPGRRQSCPVVGISSSSSSSSSSSNSSGSSGSIKKAGESESPPSAYAETKRRQSLAHTTPIHVAGGRRVSLSVSISGRASLQSYTHSSQSSQSSQPSTPAWSGWSGFSASSPRSSRRESCATIASDKHSAYGGSQGSAAGERRHSLGRRVSEYIRPPLAQDPTEGIDSLPLKRSAFYDLAD